MTPKEALKLVKSGNPVGFQVPLYHQALDIMENLIAKATPMPVAKIDNDFYCPKCRHITQYYNQTYCDICGQALDWSDDK